MPHPELTGGDGIAAEGPGGPPHPPPPLRLESLLFVRPRPPTPPTTPPLLRMSAGVWRAGVGQRGRETQGAAFKHVKTQVNRRCIKTSPKNNPPASSLKAALCCPGADGLRRPLASIRCSPETEQRSLLCLSCQSQLQHLGPPGLPDQARRGHRVNSSVPKPERAGRVCAPTAPPRKA